MKKVLWLFLLIMSISTAGCADEVRKLPMDLSGGAPVDAKYAPDVMVYEDPTIRVERSKVKSAEWKCTYYTAEITIADPSQLRTLPAGDTFLSRTTVPATNLAKRVNAVLAINGDYCTVTNTTKANSYILRQGKIYRDSVQSGLDVLLVDENGNFHILPYDQAKDSDLTQCEGKNVVNAFQFGPGLVIDGTPVPDEYILDRSHSPTYANPHQREMRMCIGQIDELHYIVVSCAFHGINLTDLRDLVLSLAPVKNLYVLDGGNSAQMIFLGTKLNNVSEGNQNIRAITDIIYFASAYFKD